MTSNAQNENLEVLVNFLKRNKAMHLEIMEKDERIKYILTNYFICVPDVSLNYIQRIHTASTPGVSFIRPFSIMCDILAVTSTWPLPFFFPTHYEFLWVKILFSLYLILLKHYWKTYHTGACFRERKCRYEIQEEKEVPVWYTGICRLISRTDEINITRQSSF
jgi:hypothetical protein